MAKRFTDLMDLTGQDESDDPTGAWFAIKNFAEATVFLELTVNGGSGVAITVTIETRRSGSHGTFTQFTFPDQAATINIPQLLTGLDNEEMRVNVAIAGTTVDADIKVYYSIHEG